MPVLGGGGGASFFGSTLEATASGAIADGDPVVLNADGTVSKVAASGTDVLPAGKYMMAVSSTTDRVYSFELGTPYDVSTMVYNGASFPAGGTNPTGLAISNDGMTLFLARQDNHRVYQVALSSPAGAAEGVLQTSQYILSQDNNLADVEFSTDGTKYFIVGDQGNTIDEFTLSQPFVLPGTFVNSFSVGTQDIYPADVAFSTDGTKMFVAGQGAVVREYTLTTGFDLSTASYSNNSFSVHAQDIYPQSIDFNTDGTKMFYVGTQTHTLYEYDLSTAWDITTASYVQGISLFTLAGTNGWRGIAFNKAITGSNLTRSSYIGIADGAYSDGATATIQLAGAIDDAQSGLTAGSVYYLNTDATLSTEAGVPAVEAGYAISPTQLLIKGAYSEVTGPKSRPTPLADARPQKFYTTAAGLYIYVGSTGHNTQATQYWTAIDQQGAYVTASSAASYTEIVDIAASGELSATFIGLPNTNNTDIFVEITIDDEVREFRQYVSNAHRAIMSFSPVDVLQRSAVNNAGNLTGTSTANFDATYTVFYSQGSTNTGAQQVIYLQPTSVVGGIRFKERLRVRFKASTATFQTSNFRNQHGVLYALD